MYLYFDRQGTLKEILNDNPFRQGDTKNKIYIYIEDDYTTNSISAKYGRHDAQVVYPLFNPSLTKVHKDKLPFDPKRELKYFKYNTPYDFYEIPTSWDTGGDNVINVLDAPGNVELTVTVDFGKLGLIVFNVEETTDNNYEIQEEEYITLAQFYYLLDNLQDKVLKSDQQNIIYGKLGNVETVFPWSANDAINTIAMRDTNGGLQAKEFTIPETNVKLDINGLYLENTIDIQDAYGNYISIDARGLIFNGKPLADTEGAITLTSDSGTIPENLQSRLNNPYCYIRYESFGSYIYYLRWREDSTYIYFYRIDTSVTHNVIDLKREYFRITKSDYSYSLSSQEYKTYNKTSLDAQLADKASIDYVDQKVAEFAQNEMQIVDVTEYPTLADFLASTGEEGQIYLYPVDTTEAPTYNSGFYRYIWENNAWLPLGTTQIDLSNYVTLDSAQTITGIKAFKNGFDFVADNYDYDCSIYINPTNDDNAEIIFSINHGDKSYYMSDGAFYADSNIDLGKSSNKWRDLYLSRYLTDGTNSITVASIVAKQDALVSGTNIKTLNGVSLLDSGNIAYDNALNGSSTNAPQTKVVYEELQNVRELAEAKANTFIVDATLTIATLKAYGSPFMFYVYNRDTKEWEDKKTELLNGDYDNLTVINSSFNSQTVFNCANNEFIITGQPHGAGSAFYLLQVGSFYGTNLISPYPLRNGYIFYVLQTDVPDRWYGTSGFTFNILEAKANLNNYYSKTESLIPAATNTYNLGSSSRQFSTLYALRVYANNGNYDISYLCEAIVNYTKPGANEIEWHNLRTFSINANTTFSFESAPTDCNPEYKAFIENSGSSAITLTFTGIDIIVCNDDNCTISSNTLTIPAGTKIEVNAMYGALIAINFEA